MRPVALLLALLLAFAAHALPRDVSERAAFRKAHPCPSTGKQSGRCPGYQIDHTRALMNGGEDRAANMQWLPHAEHRAKTRADFAECRASDTCLHKSIARRKAREQQRTQPAPQ